MPVTNGKPDISYSITSYLWKQLSGPAATITTPNSAITTVTGLSAGTYKFMLLITDNNTATIADTMTLTVNPVGAPNQPPVVNAGPDQTITLPVNNVTVSGSATDADGTIVS